jgi:hypothetical protein
MSSRSLVIVVAGLAALYVAQGLYFTYTLIPTHDAIQYLLVGAKVVRGELGVYDDRYTGNRVPLPFYVLGVTQLWGPSLVTPRLMNIGFGLGTLALTVALARHIAGPVAAVLAGLFFTTQGVAVAYYTYEGYPALAAFLFTLAAFVMLRATSPAGRVAGMFLAGILFFVRSNLWPAIPFWLAYALWRAPGVRERLALVGVVAGPLVLFFAWDPANLKILSYVPVANRLVAPLGYVASVVLDVQETLSWPAQLWQLARIARRYEFWVLAIAVVTVVEGWRWAARRAPASWLRLHAVHVVAALLLFMFVSNLLMYRWTWKWVGLYFVTFSPLLPVLLGVAYGHLLTEAPPRSWRSRALALVLVALLLPPLYVVRNPLLPIGEMLARDPFGAAHVAAQHLRRVVPPDAKVFFYGLNGVYYLSGLPQTYPQQIYKQDQFAMIPVDDWILRRSGFVPVSDMTHWLTTDAGFAVIDVNFLDYKLTIPSLGNPEALMKTLLARHFERIDTIDEFPMATYGVYRRR